MSKNIFLHELRTRFSSIAIWSASIAALTLFFFALYPSFFDQAELMQEMLKKFPPALISAFGLDKMDLATVVGFYSFLFVFVQICLAVQASNYGFGLVSIEESEWTADFLLTKPVSRRKILTSKLLAALASLFLTAAAAWISCLISIMLFRSDRSVDWGGLFLLLGSVVLFQLFFLGVGLVISLLVKRIPSVTPYGLGLAFGTYVLSAFSGIFGEVALEYLTPFKHFDPAFIVANHALNTPLVLLNLGVAVIAVGVSYWLYLRRDIAAVS